MKLKELKTLNDRPFTHAIAKLDVWQQNVSQLSNIKLIAIHNLIKLEDCKTTADRVVKSIIQATQRAEFFGYIEEPLNLWFDFYGPLTAEEFNHHMEAMDPSLQRMFILGLACDMPMSDVIALNWTRAKLMLKNRNTPDVVKQILGTQIRNVRVDYVFWQYQSKYVATPVYDADRAIQSVIDSPWADYRRRFAAMHQRPF